MENTLNNLETKLKDLVLSLSMESNQINAETNLLEDLGFDSLQILRLLVEIENQFEIKIPYQNIDYNIFTKYSSLLEHVENSVKNKQ
ncbi:acyl carrier protein [Bacillus infantis]|uniref:acyl carrier protein n=1 Tax=Bacillus infantis TaxID=324767 RepID=UPI00209FD23A|nr:acyl carrier protein [Bacillus infantis]MCP1161327.1 acyl carrier protein [Bacillus infantis]